MSAVIRLGVVSFLNARPLIAGLDSDEQVALLFDVPARLSAWLDDRRIDAALVPTVDVLRGGGHYRVLSDACIGCDGETMTVRVFSQVPPDRIRELRVDGDSHTSVALAAVLWRELYGRELNMLPFDARRHPLTEAQSVLLIGDKVVDPARGSFAYEVDLGGAWRQHTGLPFVFAMWATLGGEAGAGVDTKPAASMLSKLLSEARDQGVRSARGIAMRVGPELGWPVELAERYLTRCLSFRLDTRAVEGVDLFGRLCDKYGLTPPGAKVAWPESLSATLAPEASSER